MAHRRLERGALRQDLRLELPELGARLDPQLRDQPPPCGPEGLERLGLAPPTVERDHELAVQTLAERVLGHQRLDLGHDRAMAARAEVAVDRQLERIQS